MVRLYDIQGNVQITKNRDGSETIKADHIRIVEVPTKTYNNLMSKGATLLPPQQNTRALPPDSNG